MATTFSGYINMQLVGQMNKSLDIGTAKMDVNYNKKQTITNGTDASNANMMWTDSRTISASSSDDIDLYGGLTNSFGDTINFSAIKAIMIVASSDNVNNLIVGGDGSAFVNWVADASDKLNIKPGGMFLISDPSAGGYGVTDSSADVLQIANSSSGSSVVYDIIIVGEV